MVILAGLMDSFWLVAYLVLSGAALLLSVVLAVQTWEHRRYSRSCMRGRDRHWPTGRAAILAPCKGLDVDLEKNLAALFRQDYDNFEIVFVVEDRDDPACAAIDRLIAGHPCVAARRIVAGRSSESGQKVHNLRAAVAALGPDVQYLAFVDSDAAPRCEWLRMLLARLNRPEIGASTGYRWFLPARPSLTHYLLYSINCGVMMLLGLRGQHWVWGGSWAIRRDRFDTLGLRDAWKGTVSDDLMASRLLRDARLPTRFEPVGVVGSPLDQSFRQMFAFLRRQYLLGRHHVGFWWAVALAGCTATSLAWLASAAAVGWSLVGDGPPLWIPLGTAAALYAVGVFRGAVRQSLVKIYFPEHAAALRGAKRFDIWAGPLVALVNWLAMLGSTVGRHIRWRGVVYRMLQDGRIHVVQREQPANDAERDDCGDEPSDIISIEEYSRLRAKTG
jgi:ceramide glucosyltransferase